MAPALIMGLLGVLPTASSLPMALKASPEGSMPTRSKTVSKPHSSRATARLMTLEIL